MTEAEQQEPLERLLMDLLPADGSAIGNGPLLTGWTRAAADAGLQARPEVFTVLRAALVARGLVVKGKGRAGSTARAAASAPGSEYFELEGGAEKAENGSPVIEDTRATNKIALWSLDTDYDGRSLFPHQVFFPMAGKDEGWRKLKKNIRAELDEALLDQFHGTVSLPFEAGKHSKAAVKIVDDRGIESLKILPLRPQQAN